MELKQAFKVKGYDQLDLIEVKSSSRSFTYEPNSGYQPDKSDAFGIGVRAIVKGKVGHAFANRYEDLTKAVKQAIKFSKYSNISIDLDKYGPYKKVDKTYSKELVNLPDAKLISQLKEIIATAHSEKCNVLMAENAISEGRVRYVNSEGVDVTDKGTAFSVGWEVSEGNNACDYGFESTSFVKNISKELVRTCEYAKLQSNKSDIKTASMPVVFYHQLLASFLTYGLIPSLSAKTVQEGKSKLAGRIGEQVFSDKLTITDNGLLAGGLASSSFDSEGVPHQKTSVIEKGVLKSFLYDLARAKKDKTVSTGNGSREYTSAATVSPSNFVISKGSKDLVREVDRGVLLYGALNLHSIDSVSGDFSIGASPAFIIRRGELVGSPKKMLLSGNVYDVLRQVKAVGSDQVSRTGGLFGGSTVVSPSLLSECLVIGE